MTTGSQWFPVNPPLNGQHFLVVDPIVGPFTTLAAAKAMAQSGDCIIVMPGTYAENNLLKNGVNWFFMPGAIVSVTKTAPSFVAPDYNNDVSVVYGIFDDRSTGACTCTIGGAGTFICQSLGYTNLLGAVVITNVASNISIQCQQIGYSIWHNGAAGTGKRAAVFVTNAANVSLTLDRIYDPGVGTFIDPGNLNLAEIASGVYWELGPLFIDVKLIDRVGSYSVWGNQPNPNATAADLYIRAEQITGHMYMDGANGTYNWRTWITVGNLLEFPSYFDGGKHYLTCQKITCAGGSIGFNGATIVWLTAQKITNAGGSGWMVLGAGNGGSPRVIADVLEFEDTQGAFFNAGITINDTSYLYLRGGIMKSLGSGAATPAILHNGGTTRISGLTIDTSNTNNAANNPVKVAAAGLILDKCVLVAPALADSVTSAAAQTIKAYSCKTNKAKNANITVQVDALTVDVNVA